LGKHQRKRSVNRGVWWQIRKNLRPSHSVEKKRKNIREVQQGEKTTFWGRHRKKVAPGENSPPAPSKSPVESRVQSSPDQKGAKTRKSPTGVFGGSRKEKSGGSKGTRNETKSPPSLVRPTKKRKREGKGKWDGQRSAGKRQPSKLGKKGETKG